MAGLRGVLLVAEPGGVMLLELTEYESPVGPLLGAVSEGSLVLLEFRTQLPVRMAGAETRAGDPLRMRARLDAYFREKQFDAFDGLPLAPEGPEFHQKVWTLLRRIRPGHTRAYGDLAKELGDPLASRAVGRANGANPIAIVVPCHRVIGKDGSLTGYAGGLHRKHWLLVHEGALLI